MSASRFFSRSLIAALLSSLIGLSQAQVRGSVETFGNEANALSWFIFDASDEMVYDPAWDLLGVGDPDIFTVVTPGSSVSFLADSNTSGGELVGDYHGQRITGIGCEAYVEDASGLVNVEFCMLSNDIFYYSVTFTAPPFFGSGGFEDISVSFTDDPWYVLVDGEFEEVDLTNEILSNVAEVGVSFFANESRTEAMAVAIDDFYLVPETIVPELSVARNGGNFELSFKREVSQEYDVNVSSTLGGWTGLEGHADITGETDYTVLDPIGERRFYQVDTDFFFTIIPDVDS